MPNAPMADGIIGAAGDGAEARQHGQSSSDRSRPDHFASTDGVETRKECERCYGSSIKFSRAAELGRILGSDRCSVRLAVMWLDRRLGCYRRRIRHRGDDRGSGDCRRRRQPSRLPERDLLADSRDRIPNPADDLVELTLRQPQAASSRCEPAAADQIVGFVLLASEFGDQAITLP